MKEAVHFTLQTNDTLIFTLLKPHLLMIESPGLRGQFDLNNTGFDLLGNKNHLKLQCYYQHSGENYQGWNFKTEEYNRLLTYFSLLGFLRHCDMPKAIRNMSLGEAERKLASGEPF